MRKSFILALFGFSVAAACCAAETPAVPDKAPDPNADFKTYASGEKAVYWSQMFGSKKYLPRGKVEIADGKVTIVGGKAEMTGIWFFRSHKLPKFRIEPGDLVKISLTAAGSGQLGLSIDGYRADGQHYHCYRKSFDLAAEPKTVSHEFRLNHECVQLYPSIYVMGDGKATVSDFRMEVLPAEL